MLKTLQAGRALAAIGVAAFHLSDLMSLSRYGGQGIFREYTKYGSHGVDFFFVLSGFIILFAHINDIGNRDAWVNFVYRRFVRLFPIYWLYTGTFVLLLALGAGTEATPPRTFGDWFTTISLIRFSDVSPPLQVAWSLFHELAFYTVFSILILSVRAGSVAIVLLVFANIFFYHYPISDNASALSVYTSPYNLNFLFGMSAVWLHRRRGGAANFTVGIFISTAVLLSTHLPNKFALILLAIGFALIVAGATALERCGRLRVPSFLVFVGNASYSIYLVHVSFEGLLLKIALNTHYYELMGAGSTYFTVLTGTILIGCVAYFTVERPLLRALQRPGKQISTKHENQLMGTKLTTGCNGIEQRNRE